MTTDQKQATTIISDYMPFTMNELQKAWEKGDLKEVKKCLTEIEESCKYVVKEVKRQLYCIL